MYIETMFVYISCIILDVESGGSWLIINQSPLPGQKPNEELPREVPNFQEEERQDPGYRKLAWNLQIMDLEDDLSVKIVQITQFCGSMFVFRCGVALLGGWTLPFGSPSNHWIWHPEHLTSGFGPCADWATYISTKLSVSRKVQWLEGYPYSLWN